MCTSGSCRCKCPQPGIKLRDTKLLQVKQNITQTFRKYELLYLEFRLSSASVWVAQEGDECRPGCVFFIVVLRAVTVNQLNQAVVVRQTRVRFTQTPGSEGERGVVWRLVYFNMAVNACVRGYVESLLTALWLTS